MYYFLPRVKRGQSTKLQTKWIGPFQIRRVISDSLIVIYPIGTWAIHPREISTIVSRVKKVDPNISSTGLFPSRREWLDLDTLGGGLEEADENLGFQDDVADVESREFIDGQIPLSVELPPPMGIADNETPVNLGHAPNPENSDPLEPLANPLNLGPADGGVELSPLPYRVLDPDDPGGSPPRLNQTAGNGAPIPGAHTPTAPHTYSVERGGGLSGAQRENWERGVSPPRMENPINIPPIDNSPVEHDPYSVWVDQLLDKSKNRKGKANLEIKRGN